MFTVRSRWEDTFTVYGIIKENEEYEEYDDYLGKSCKYVNESIQFLIYKNGEWCFVDSKYYEPIRQ